VLELPVSIRRLSIIIFISAATCKETKSLHSVAGLPTPTVATYVTISFSIGKLPAAEATFASPPDALERNAFARAWSFCTIVLAPVVCINFANGREIDESRIATGLAETVRANARMVVRDANGDMYVGE